MILRPERASDVPAIRRVLEAAFPTRAEADLVDALRAEADPFVSWVAEDETEVVGHIVFTPVTLGGRDAESDLRVAGLAPMAVLPTRQRRGVGTRLLPAALDGIRGLGFGAVVVLGHPDYYPRFGFVPASRFGLRSTYDVPDEVFMAQELRPGALDDVSGTVRYHPAFAGV